MDDLQKDVYRIWELRLRLEKVKKRSKLMAAVLESEEFKSEHSESEYKKARKQVDEIIKEQEEIEVEQARLEEKIKLPNPYLKQAD